MLWLLLRTILRRISVHFFYLAWVRTAAATLVLWLIYSFDAPWFAQAALTVTLFLLLISGVLLLAAGFRDLARDFWHFLHARPH
jgi:hypothetical protein